METIAIICGAASGIGKSTYNLLKKEYENIKFILLDKKEVELLDDKDVFYNIDFSNIDCINLFIKEFFVEEKQIKFLINCVGYQDDFDVLSLDNYNWDKMYNTTVKSVFFLEQEVSKMMIKNVLNNQTIINVTSIHTEIIRDIPHYSSAKASLKMLSKELAYKLANYGIRINCVEPGSIDTPLLRSSLTTEEQINEAAQNIPLLRHGFPEEVANLIKFLVSDNASYITGTSIAIDGGLSLVM